MAAKKIGLVLALDGEKEFKSAIKAVKEEVKLYGDSIKNLDKAFAENRNSAEALTKKQEALTKQQEAYRKQVDAAKSGLENAKKQYNEQADALRDLNKRLEDAEKELKQMSDAGDDSSDAYKKQKEEVDKLSTAISKQTANLNTAQGRVNTWTRELNNSEAALDKCDDELRKNEQYLDEASKSADGCATSIDKFGNEVKDAEDDTNKLNISLKDMVKNKLVDMGGDILRDLGRKAIEAAKYVVEVGSSFEASMSKVKALSGATTQQMDQMSAKAKELGSSTKFSATEVADAFSYMSLAGWDTESMLTAVDGVVNLAASSEMGLAEASDMVTDYISAFGLSASDAAHMVDMLAYAQANSNTTTQQIGEAWKNCAANMNAAGQDMETTTSLLEALANQGLKGSEAGTKLAAIMRDLTSKMEDGKIQIGDTSVAVMDSNGNFRDMTDILADVEKATDGMGTAEKAAALQTTFTSESVSGLNMILNEGVGNIAAYEEELRNSDGAAANMAATMQDNLAGKVTALNSALEGLGIAVYNYVSGPLQGVVSTVTGVISGITDAITPQKTELESFIESIEASNAQVDKSIANAKATVANAEAKVAGLEATKEFLQGVLDNCSKFTETDLSGAAGKIDTDLSTAETAFKDTDEAAKNAKTSAEDIGKANISTTKISLATGFIKSKMTSTEESSKDLKESLGNIGDASIDETNVSTYATNAQNDLGNTTSSAEGTSKAISAIGDASVDETNVETYTTDLDWFFADARGKAEETATSISDVGEAEIDTSGIEGDIETIDNVFEGTITTADALGSHMRAVDETKLEGLSEHVGEQLGKVDESLTTTAGNADTASTSVSSINKVRFVSAADRFKNLASKATEYFGSVKTDVGGANEQITEFTESTEGINGAAEALGYMKDEEAGVVVVTDELTKSQITNVVNQLKDTVPELASAWNEETGELSLTNEQLLQYVENAEKVIMAKAYSETLEELWRAVAESELEEVKARSALNKAQEESNDTLTEGAEIATQYGSDVGFMAAQTGVASEEVTRASMALKEAEENTAECRNAVTDFTNAAKGMDLEVNGTTVSVKEYSDATEEGTEADANAVDQKQLLIDALNSLSDAESDTTESTEALTAAQAESIKAFQDMAGITVEQMASMMESMGMSASEFAEWCQTQVDGVEELKKDYASLTESIESSLSNYIDALDATDKEGKASLENLKTNLETKLNDIRTWGENMTTLAGMIGNGFSQELYDSIVEQGYEKSAETVQLLVGSIDKETGQFNEEGQKAAELLQQGLTEPTIIAQGAAAQTAIGKQYAEAQKNGYTGTLEEYKAAVVGVTEAGAEAATESAGQYTEPGETAGNSMAEGMSNEEDTVSSAAETIASAGVAAIEKADLWFEAAGGAAINAFRRGMIGIQNGAGSPSAKAEEIASAAADAAKTTSESGFKNAGKAGVEAFGSGISNNKHLSNAQALAAATEAGEAIDKRRYMFTGAGQAAVQAFGSGIGNNKHISNMQALNAATEAGEAIDKRRYMFTGAGQAAVQAFGSGISGNSHIANMQALNAATEAGSAIDKRRYMFSGAGSEAAQAFANGISNSSGSASSAAGSASLNAAYSARGYYSSFYYAGSYVIDGFASGINAYSYKAAYAAASAAASALASARARLGVASPSKEFIKIGRFVDEGFAQGIEKNQKLIEDAAEKASKATIDTANEMNIRSKLDIVGAERLNQLTNVRDEAFDNAMALRKLTEGLSTMSALAESLTNPSAPNVTVMIGNREFKGYIVNTAIEGMGQKQKNLRRGVGA